MNQTSCPLGDPSKCPFIQKTGSQDQPGPSDLKGNREASRLVSFVNGTSPATSSGREDGAEEAIQARVARWRARGITPQDEQRAETPLKRTIIPSYTFQFTGSDFILAGYNEAAEAETRDKLAAYIGKKASELLTDRPDILEDIRGCYRERSTSVRRGRYRMFPNDEEKKLTAFYTFVPPDLVQIITQDVTELEFMRLVLKESEKKYRSIFESALAGIYRTRGEDGKILMANQALAEILGYDSAWQLMSETRATERYVHPEKGKELGQRLRRDGRVDSYEF
ncbi:MAG: PAS domain S-box protein, partial [Deltaproteobacteria bacterium]|nr:PAS domain S-box protein [Deltaproteobacteria bacterium]